MQKKNWNIKTYLFPLALTKTKATIKTPRIPSQTLNPRLPMPTAMLLKVIIALPVMELKPKYKIKIASKISTVNNILSMVFILFLQKQFYLLRIFLNLLDY